MARSTIPMQYKMRKTSAKCGRVLSLYVLTGLYFQDARDVRGGEGGRVHPILALWCAFFCYLFTANLEGD